jgi:iron complex outermembrane receptor protein
VGLGLATQGRAHAQEAVLEEILVTAQKRQESMQEVATSVSVFSGADLAELGMREPMDLAMQTPGLVTAVGRDGLKAVGFYMRGVGITDFSGTIDSSVAVYVDEVFKTSPDMYNFAIFDIERVEVLKGPQGTLYGRNSTGGAVNFISAPPTRETEGYFRTEYQSYGVASLEGAISGELGENLLGRIAVTGQRHIGDSSYSHNRFTGDALGQGDSTAARVQLHWTPGDKTDVRLSYTYGEIDEEPPLLAHVGGLDAGDLGNGIVRICDSVIAGVRSEGECVSLTGYFDPDRDFYDGSADVDQFMETEAHNFTLKIEHAFERSTLTAISGFDTFEKSQATDIDVSPLIGANKDIARSKVDSFSQEIRITSDDSWRIPWIFGAYYFESDVDWFQTIDLTDALGVDTSNGAEQSTESWAAFGQLSLPLSERVELEAGLRFTHEEREWIGGSFVGTYANLRDAFANGGLPLSALPIPAGGTAEGFQPGSPQDFNNVIKEDNTDFRTALKFHLNEDAMFYASVSEGFRSGGVPSAVIFSQSGLEPFDIESLRSYEAGFKLSLSERRVELNASAFFYDYEGYQATFVRSTELSARLQNAGDVEIKGLELSARWLATDNLLLDGGISLLDNEIVSTDVTLPPLDPSEPTTTIKGNEVANAPSYSINGRVRYEFPAIGGFRPNAQVDFKYLDDHFLEPNNRAVLAQDGYLLLNARIGAEQEDGGWDAAIWVKNITDEEYVVAGEDLFLAVGLGTWVLGQPRTYGIQLGYRF